MPTVVRLFVYKRCAPKCGCHLQIITKRRLRTIYVLLQVFAYRSARDGRLPHLARTVATTSPRME